MAGQVYPPGFRAFDATGAAYSGAKLYTYVPGTTSPKTTYTTSDLSVAHANPIVADSNGVFPQAWADDNATFDLVLTTSAGVSLDSWEDVTALAVNTDGSISRDFGTGGRLLISGTGGTVTVAAGPPQGDDTGGTMELAGQGGTALDTLRFNARNIELAGGAALFLQNYLTGLTLSAAGSADDFGIAAGQAADSTNTSIITLAQAITKTTGSWAAGSGNGALDDGTIANSTWYHVWLIRNPTDDLVDVLVSTSASAPTMPSGYTLKRRIGSMKTDGSAQWVKFTQLGDEFLWDAPVADETGTTVGTTAVLLDLTVPTGIKVHALFSATWDNGGGALTSILFTSPDQADTAPSTNVADGVYNSAQVTRGHISLNRRTNTSAQIRARQSNNTSAEVWLTTHGWIDRRGRDG